MCAHNVPHPPVVVCAQAYKICLPDEPRIVPNAFLLTIISWAPQECGLHKPMESLVIRDGLFVWLAPDCAGPCCEKMMGAPDDRKRDGLERANKRLFS